MTKDDVIATVDSEGNLMFRTYDRGAFLYSNHRFEVEISLQDHEHVDNSETLEYLLTCDCYWMTVRDRSNYQVIYAH